MKILIIQERGQHIANRHFRESCCLKRSFDRLGHNCVIWGLGHENFQSEVDFNSFDIIINLENYGESWIPNLINIKNPLKMIWCIDAHHRGESVYENIFMSKGFDILAHSTLDFVKKPYHRWLPNCTDVGLLVPIPSIKKEQPLGFCGNYASEERKQILNSLSLVLGLRQDIFVIGDDMVRAINSYLVHFNMNISNDINYRSFETLACQTVLLTNHDHQYEKLGFVDGENCFMYRGRDLRTIVAKTTSVLNTSKEDLDLVANRGRQLVLNRHTYDHRAIEILDIAAGKNNAATHN